MAEQFLLQDSKEKFQTAFDKVISVKEAAEAKYQDEKEMGLTEDSFYNWAAQNYPLYPQAEVEYESAKASYEAALQQFDIQGYNAWQEKVRQAVDDAHRAGNFARVPFVAPNE
jgi:hypothetical protein